jgi:hypothetical protein
MKFLPALSVSLTLLASSLTQIQAQDLSRVSAIQQAQIQQLQGGVSKLANKNPRFSSVLTGGRWYRIATLTPHSYSRYHIRTETSGRHDQMELAVSRTFERGRWSMENRSFHNGYGWGITHIRFVTNGMYDPWYLEVYLPTVASYNSVQFTIEERFNDSNKLLQQPQGVDGSASGNPVEYNIMDVVDAKGPMEKVRWDFKVNT